MILAINDSHLMGCLTAVGRTPDEAAELLVAAFKDRIRCSKGFWNDPSGCLDHDDPKEAVQAFQEYYGMSLIHDLKPGKAWLDGRPVTLEMAKCCPLAGADGLCDFCPPEVPRG